MSKAIPNRSLKSARQCLELLMDFTASVNRETVVPSSSGSHTRLQTEVTPCVKCSMDSLSEVKARDFVGAERSVGVVEFTFPVGTDLDERDVVTVNGESFEILSVQSQRSDHMILYAWGTRVSP